MKNHLRDGESLGNSPLRALLFENWLWTPSLFMSPQPNILESFLKEFKPGTNEDFNCLLSTEDVIRIIGINSNIEIPHKSVICEMLRQNEFVSVTVDGEEFWKIVE